MLQEITDWLQTTDVNDWGLVLRVVCKLFSVGWWMIRRRSRPRIPAFDLSREVGVVTIAVRVRVLAELPIQLDLFGRSIPSGPRKPPLGLAEGSDRSLRLGSLVLHERRVLFLEPVAELRIRVLSAEVAVTPPVHGQLALLSAETSHLAGEMSVDPAILLDRLLDAVCLVLGKGRIGGLDLGGEG